MMSMKAVLPRLLLTGLLACSVFGCATPHTTRSTGFTGFLAFEGTQLNWPRASSSLIKADFAVPAYLGLPSRSYRVIGFVVNTEPEVGKEGLPAWLWSDETRLANACNQARDHGADAVLLTKDPVFLRAMNPQEGHPPPAKRLLTNFDGVIVAIQWADRR